MGPGRDRNGEITLSITDVGTRFFDVASMSFNAIREKIIFAKISGFTVSKYIKWYDWCSAHVSLYS